ncbi:hypothetical protein WA026_017367 [Henosepilachna vigintioctopunctata]|uniref:Uncharacterized protein n=1 Tax=Henosepilachna vigintioctopunctata TaxID=420089 RepID=A0AAW1V863_9CUCU
MVILEKMEHSKFRSKNRSKNKMADFEVSWLNSQLKRLNKDDLISIIVNKSFPVNNVTGMSGGIQEKLKNMVETHLLLTPPYEINKVTDIHAGGLSANNVLMYEKLITQFEKRTSEQELLISLLNSRIEFLEVNKTITSIEKTSKQNQSSSNSAGNKSAVYVADALPIKDDKSIVTDVATSFSKSSNEKLNQNIDLTSN